jgi:3-oxoacyl-[acyl-carrier protein] reductase
MSKPGQKVALVTGAGRRNGIGAAICRRLASDGADICFTTLPAYDQSMPLEGEPDWAQTFARELNEFGGRSYHAEIDLSDANAVERLIPEVARKLGPLCILVNNAAHSVNGGIDELTAQSLNDHYVVNFRAAALLCASFAQFWNRQDGGRIVNMTSGQSLGPMPEELAYASSKGAVEAFTTSVAPALLARGITINAVNPGPTDTGWIGDDLRRELIQRFPSGRIGTPEDVARLVAFLCSEEAAWITGQIIHSEGGFTRS